MADIKKQSAIISMVILGILSIIFAIRGFVVDLTPSVWGFVGLGIGIILISEVGIKKMTKLSRLKTLQTQQKISLVIALIVLVTATGLLFNHQIPVLSEISNGSFLTGGVFVILEALSF